MQRKIILSILALGALGVAAVFGASIYRTAQAAVPTYNSLAHIDFGKGLGGGYNNQYLADALGISVDQLNTAYQNASNSAIDQAVKDGLITQAQADDLKSRGSAFPFGGRWGEWLSRNGIDFDTFLANALGITVDKLHQAYAQAFNARVDQALADGKITQEEADLIKGRYALFSSESFQTSMRNAFEAAVNQAVSAGIITQAQADQILSSYGNMGFPGFHGPGGFGRGFGRHGGWGGGLRLNPGTPATPEVSPSNGI